MHLIHRNRFSRFGSYLAKLAPLGEDICKQIRPQRRKFEASEPRIIDAVAVDEGHLADALNRFTILLRLLTNPPYRIIIFHILIFKEPSL